MTNLKKNYPRKSDDVPATKAMLYLVRDGLEASDKRNYKNLKSDIENLRAEVKADIQSLRKEVKTDIQDLKDFIKFEMHQMKLLIEEQNARNIFVLDGLTSLFDRQDRLEKRVDKLEKDI